MPIDYKGYTVPELDDGANANVAFKQFADSVVAAGGGGVPVGCVMPYVGDTAPDATWRICDGQELDVTVYPELFAVIGAKFGTAKAGYFKVPDMRGAVARGAGVSGLGGGWTGGAIGAAPSASQSLSLTEAHMPSHAHAQTDHSHVFTGTASTHTSTVHDVRHSHGEDTSTADNSATTHTHATMFRVGNNFVKTGGGAGLVPENSVSNSERTAAAGGNASVHTHKIHDATVPHQHNVTVTPQGTVSGGAGNLTAAAGSGSPTAINLVGPAVSLNYIIKVKP